MCCSCYSTVPHLYPSIYPFQHSWSVQCCGQVEFPLKTEGALASLLLFLPVSLCCLASGLPVMPLPPIPASPVLTADLMVGWSCMAASLSTDVFLHVLPCPQPCDGTSPCLPLVSPWGATPLLCPLLSFPLSFLSLVSSVC